MKYLKKFIHITELNSFDNFIFAINIKNATDEDIDKLYKMSKKYFNKFDYFSNNYNYFMAKIKKTQLKPWAIIYNMYNDINNRETAISFVETPSWGEGYEYMDNIITLNEFFKIGFENVEEYINIKNNTKKFNL